MAFWTLYKRELNSYFQSAVAYVVLFGSAVIQSMFFCHSPPRGHGQQREGRERDADLLHVAVLLSHFPRAGAADYDARFSRRNLSSGRLRCS